MKIPKRDTVKENFSIRLPADIKNRLIHLRDEKEFEISNWIRDTLCLALANLSLTASDPSGSGWLPNTEAASFADLNAPRNTEKWRWVYEAFISGRNRSKT